MVWIIVVVAALVLIYFARMWLRGIHLFNVANSIILAAITYEKFDLDRRKAADEMLRRILTLNSKQRETFEALWHPDREIARWRWYSLAFASEQIAPAHEGALKWERCKRNVFRDVKDMIKGRPDFEDRLARREPYDRYLRYLR